MARKHAYSLLNPRDDVLLSVYDSRLLSAAPVLITISSTRNKIEEISLMTRGMLTSMTNSWGLYFSETGNKQMDAFTYLVCEENAVSISRISDTVSTIIHRTGETYLNSHQIPGGVLSTHIFTHFVQIKRRGRTGQIHISYQINLSDRSTYPDIYVRHLYIRFRPCK